MINKAGESLKRIDKIISEQTNYSRKDIKKLISQGLVFVNGIMVRKPEEKYDDEKSLIEIEGKILEIRRHIYILLNKPKGYISTTDKGTENTVLDLVDDKYKIKDLFPAGRLDKDTTGLMLITDDGEFCHNILSPKKHIKKVYEVTLDIPVTESMKRGFKKGVLLKDFECQSAELEITGKYTCLVTIHEGKYHQIKRMFGCYGAKVIELNRLCMGNLELPKDIKIGESREALKEELNMIIEEH